MKYRIVLSALALTTMAFGLSACGQSSGTTTTPAAASSSAAPGRGAHRQPGTSGTVAALSGSTMQVQSTASQTAVTFSASTKFTDAVRGALSDVKAGDCVTVTGTNAAVSIEAKCPTAGPAKRGNRGNNTKRPFTTGKVSAVSGTGFTVNGTQVAVTPTTVYTKTVTADSAALKVGLCVTAQGKAGDTGAVSATSIAIRQPGPDGCSVARGFRSGQGNG